MKQQRKFKETEIRKNNFIGIWSIIKMGGWDNDYVNEEVQAFTKTEKSGSDKFHFGLVQGSMYGDFEKWDGNLIYDFAFKGCDECDSATGNGWMKIKEDCTKIQNI